MTYSSFMVHLDLGVPNEAILRVAAELAERYDASVTGIVACQPLIICYGDGNMSPELFEEDRKLIDRNVAEAEAQFRSALKRSGSKLNWRSAIGYESLSSHLADQACVADVFLIAPQPGEWVMGQSRHVELGDLVMQIGRPVLVVPPSGTLDLDRVIVGWRNTRECRRAVWDALPMLRNAGRVTLVQIADAAALDAIRKTLQEVVAWLEGHGVAAEFEALPSSGGDNHCLEAVAAERRAGLMVSGAYGHNRMREWVLGGVTRDLLTHPTRCSLLSH